MSRSESFSSITPEDLFWDDIFYKSVGLEMVYDHTVTDAATIKANGDSADLDAANDGLLGPESYEYILKLRKSIHQEGDNNGNSRAN